MSCSKYASTPETTNLARISRLILGPCADVMRDVLLKEVPIVDLSRRVKSWLKSNTRNTLNKSQTDLIFPPPTEIYSGDYSDLDISLLYTLLRNVTNLPAHSQGWSNDPDPTDRSVSANIERLRLIRNKYYGHAVHIGMPDNDFQLEFSNIRDIVKEVDIHLGFPKHQLSVDSIRTQTMDPVQEKKWIDKLSVLDSLVTDVEQHKEEINELKRKVESFESIDMSIKAKMDTTRVALECQERQIRNVLVHTRAMKKVSDILQTNRYVVIKGNPGAGKTTIAMHVLIELYKKGKLPLQVTTVQDLYGSVSPFSNVALFLDNLFGEFTLSNEVDNFDSKLHLIRAMCSNDNNDKGNVLIVTIRSDIYNEAAEKRSTGESFFTNSVIDISNGDFQLQDSEIIEFFEKYGLDKLLKSNSLLDIGKIGCTFGIPQCCSLLKNNPTLSEDTFGFLKNPIQSLQIYLESILNRKECKTAVLVYLLLCGGSVEEKVLQKASQDIPRKKQSLEIIGAKNATLMDFQRSIYHYHNFLMTFDPIEREYKFSHSSVQESLFRCLINFYPNEIIKSCDHVLLERLTTCKNMSWNSIVIPEEFFQEIIKRLLELLEETSESAFRTVSRLQIWKDEKFMSECERNQTLLRGIKQNTDSCGRTMLIHFCVSGNIRWVKYLLPSSSQEQRYMSLNEACEHNHDAIVDLILATDVKYNLKTCFHAVHSGNLSMLYRFTDNVDLKKITLSTHKDCNNEWGLLHEICVLGQNYLIKPVLTRYPQLLDVQNDEGGNALHFVAYAGDETVFKNLVQAGLDPYSRSYHGSTVLHFACQNGQLNMIKYICDEFPELLSSDYNNKEGWSPLHFSAQSGNIESYEYLIEKGVKQTFSNDGSTHLHGACKAGKLEMCKFLVNAYPHLLNIKNNNGENALHGVAFGGNTDLYRFLMGKGLDIESKTNNGKTALHLSCMNGKLDMCKYLVNTYPQLLYVKDNNGDNALHGAALGGNTDLFTFLVGKGFDINCTNTNGENVLHLCCLNGKLDMCKYLVNNYPHLQDDNDKAGNSVLYHAIKGGNVNLFKFLLGKRYDDNTNANELNTVLCICCLEQQLEMCRCLVNTYFQLLHIKDIKDVNGLHIAASVGNIDIFNFLLDKGLDIESTTNDGKTVLHLCCMKAKLQICKIIISRSSHLLNIKDLDGNSVLHDAASGGSIDLFKFLLEKGVDIETLRNDGKTVLHICCIMGNLDMCKYLVCSHSNLLNIKNNDGNNALHTAAWSGNIDLFKFLLEKGVDIETLRNDGKTVLHMCCIKGNLDMCKYLVGTQPNLLNVKDNDGNNALHVTALGGNIDLFKFLMEKGFDIETLRNDGKTVLHICCENGNLYMCKYLVSMWPNILNVKDNDGNNALHTAAWSGNIDVFKFLLEKGFDIKTTRGDGRTVLHLSCANGKLDASRYLVENYSKYNLLYVKNDEGENALHDAALGGNVDLLKFLLEKGFNSKSTRYDGKNVLYLCCSNGKLDMCKYLVRTYPHLIDVKDSLGNNALHAAAWGGNIDVFKFLLENGFDIKVTDKEGKNVLHLCCMNGQLDMCKYLVENYFNLLYIEDNEGRNVLHSAAIGGSIDLFEFLLERGFDIQTTKGDGKTVLHLCCMHGKLDLCKYLVKHSSHLLHIKDIGGFNILHAAAWGGNIDLFNILLRKGFNIKTTNDDGKTVLHFSCMNGKVDMCEYLVNTFPRLFHIKDYNGENALFDASWSGNIDVFKFLLGKGLQVEITRNDGKTVLHLCCVNGKLDMCKYLLNTFPHLLNVKDIYYQTALNIARLYKFNGVSNFLESVVSKSRRGQKRKEMHV